MRYFIMSDPARILPSVKCPVLALNGSKDCQVLAEKNIGEIERILTESGNSSVTALVMPDLNHLFQKCETGLVDEYGEIEETFSPEVLDIISDWIKKAYGKRRKA